MHLCVSVCICVHKSLNQLNSAIFSTRGLRVKPILGALIPFLVLSCPASFPQPLDPALEAEIEEAVTKKSRRRKSGALGPEVVTEAQEVQARVVYVARIPHGFYENQMSGEGNMFEVEVTEEDSRAVEDVFTCGMERDVYEAAQCRCMYTCIQICSHTDIRIHTHVCMYGY